ncbi:MAG: carboxypeptidase-like regulatory domain-containing protein, partial [Gemmatimonadota bacterium]|nr:carboxypeptidase-like regulatory domain-containing protein [Gemmatimonadota bacterium]
MGTKLRLIAFVAVTGLFSASSTAAQMITVTVREDGTERRIAGAIVSVQDSGDTSLVARFTNDSGVATLRLPVRGEYRLVVRRVGYRPRMTPMNAGEKGTADITVRLTPIPPIVTTVVVHADSSCAGITTKGADVSLVWESVRSALEATRLTESQRLVRMEVETYDRDLDRQLHERSTQTRRKVADTRQPFSAASPAELESRGYVTTVN